MSTRAEELLAGDSATEKAETVAAFLELEGWPTYAAIVRALGNVAATASWQPIATAPKDGSGILLCYRWARRRYVGEGYWAPAGHWTVMPGTLDVRATHWQPLMPLPQMTG